MLAEGVTAFDPLLPVERKRSGRWRTSLSACEPSLAERLLNQVVRPRQHRSRDGEVERLCRAEIDDQPELCWLLNGKIISRHSNTLPLALLL